VAIADRLVLGHTVRSIAAEMGSRTVDHLAQCPLMLAGLG
jgi:hypothetical protein